MVALDSQVDLDSQDPKVTLELQEHQEAQDSEDPLDQLDQLDVLEHQVVLDPSDLLEDPVPKVLLYPQPLSDLLVLMVPLAKMVLTVLLEDLDLKVMLVPLVHLVSPVPLAKMDSMELQEVSDLLDRSDLQDAPDLMADPDQLVHLAFLEHQEKMV